MITLDTPIEDAPKISRSIIPALKRLEIYTVRDLLMHLPSRYEDFSNNKHIADVMDGETVTVRGIIRALSRFRTKTSGKLFMQASVEDDTGAIKAIWFNQPYLFRNLAVGTMVNLSGKAELRKGGMFLQNPSHEKISSRSSATFIPIHTGKLVPVYPETRGITSRWLRYLIFCHSFLADSMEDPLPEATRNEFDLLELKRAISHIHSPHTGDDIRAAMRRFQFEQLFIIQLFSLHERIEMARHHAPGIAADVELIKQFVASLPFPLTDAQRRSSWEIMKDMEKPIPMNRLLEGDVGSGKTVVAAAALLLTSRAGKRACLLAPTEILAKQHAETLAVILKPFDIRVGVYTSSEKRIPAHTSVFVGTHALLQKNIRISDLALVIIDEQHRFGVEQRAALLHHHRDAPEHPHFLSMTATPIPRTLALTIYGDLDVSMLDEMPKNRKTIITKVVNSDKRKDAYDFIREEMKRGQQVFVICPRIEAAIDIKPSGTGKKVQATLLAAEVKTVIAEYEKLAHAVFPDFRVSMLHGKMKPKDKERIMKDFYEHKTDILVSTSVIEVGVDVPNATVMMIEGAEWFGLAQLHQFRGRVGRGSEQSYCFLFPTEPNMASDRLESLVQARNGFDLAEIDLRLRGPGDFLGTKQWGMSDIAMTALANPALVRDVRKAARETLAKDPERHAFPLLKDKIAAMVRMIHRE